MQSPRLADEFREHQHECNAAPARLAHISEPGPGMAAVHRDDVVNDGLRLGRGRELSLSLRGGGGRRREVGERLGERAVLSHRLDDSVLDSLGLEEAKLANAQEIKRKRTRRTLSMTWVLTNVET